MDTMRTAALLEGPATVERIEDADVVRAMFDAFNRDGVEAALAYLDPEVEWIAPPEWLEEPVYRGHDGVRRVASLWYETFDQYRLELEALFEIEGGVLALVTRRGHMKGTGVVITQKIAYAWELRNGKGLRLQVYFSWEDALTAAGLGAEAATVAIDRVRADGKRTRQPRASSQSFRRNAPALRRIVTIGV
jgi:ketosteroid isomerase-like protein